MDRGDCIEVFQNLLQNACEAMPKGGPVTVQVRTQRKEVTVSIRDSGPGVPSDRLGKIFSPHFTTKQSGQGLGLYRTRVLVEQYGGQIRVVSVPQKGSTCIVTLPMANDADIIRSSRTTG
nr:ATP-binding protein [Sulfobacillus harzensis]